MAGRKEYVWDAVGVGSALDLASMYGPGGFKEGGLPTGRDIRGPAGSDRLVLEAAEAIERGLQMWQRNPPNEKLEVASTR